MNILFATDLDNTLMYSHVHRKPDDVCVEHLNGKEQGFMSKSVYEALPYISKHIDIIPITTRSMEQFDRIKFPDNIITRAFIANGAFDYNTRTGDMTKTFIHLPDYIDELDRIYNILKNDPRTRITNHVDDSYVYASFNSNEIANEVSASISSFIAPVVSNRKLYYIPAYYTKKAAIRKIKHDYDLVISAGDSELDIDMLNEADIAIIPKELNSYIKTNTLVCPDNMRLSDYVILCLLNKIE